MIRHVLMTFFSVVSCSIFSQSKISIDSITGLTCFDSITEIGMWRLHKTYYEDSIIRDEIRFRIWGDGCSVINSVDDSDKCFFKSQRQSYFFDGKIQEKEGLYGWHTRDKVKVIHQLLIYNKKGKLLYVEKKKHNK